MIWRLKDSSGSMIVLKRSKATSYKEIAKFWGTHDLADSWSKIKEASFKVDIESEVTYYAWEDRKLGKCPAFPDSLK